MGVLCIEKVEKASAKRECDGCLDESYIGTVHGIRLIQETKRTRYDIALVLTEKIEISIRSTGFVCCPDKRSN
jgi:hypothetical protein